MRKIKIHATDTMKVVDVDQSQVHADTIGFLEDQHKTYADQVLTEHLLDIEGAVDNEELSKESKRVRSEIKELHKIAGSVGAAYVRFVN